MNRLNVAAILLPPVLDCKSCGPECSYSGDIDPCYGQVRIIEQDEEDTWHGCEGHKNMIWDGRYIPYEPSS